MSSKLWGMFRTASIVVGLGILLAACAGTKFATVDGACAGFERPAYQVLGKRPYDQNWADKTTEAGVAGCGWARPEARPAVLDMPVKAPAKPVARPVVRRHWFGHPKPAPVPAAPTSAVPKPSDVPQPPSAAPAPATPAPVARVPTHRQKIVNKLKSEIERLKAQLRKYQPHDKL